MGNTLVKDTGTIKDTSLGNFIKEWSTTYTIDPPDNELQKKIFTDTLKKRACCLTQPEINIGIAGFEEYKDEKDGNQVKKRIVNYTVGIPVFNNAEDITKDGACNLQNGNGEIKSFKGDLTGSVPSGNDNCIAFYNEFASKVTKIRSVHSKLNDKLYGINPDKQTNYDHKANQFLDTNCLTGLYTRPELNLATPQQYEQGTDARCADLTRFTYKPSREVITMCANIININGKVEASDGGEIKITQTCQTEAEQKKAKELKDKEEAAKIEDLQRQLKDQKDAATRSENEAIKKREDEARAAEARAAEAKAAEEEAYAKKKAEEKEATDTEAAQDGQVPVDGAPPLDEPAPLKKSGSSSMILIFVGIGICICIIFIVIFFILYSSKPKPKLKLKDN